MRNDPRRKKIPRGVIWGIVGLIIFFVVGFTISFFIWRQKAKVAVASQAEGFQSGISDLQSLDFQSAEQQFNALAASTTGMQNAAGAASIIFGKGNAVGALVDLPKQLSIFSEELGSAENDVFNVSSSAPQGSFINDAGALRDTLHSIDRDTTALSSAASSLNVPTNIGGIDLLGLETKMQGAEALLDELVPWLSDGAQHHVLVLLQNPSELRASGGFLGSYADITIASGTVADISVHDIADVDAAFTENVVPPKQLQLEQKRWRPADANWFFDFPTSASKTIWFFENSGLYNGTATSSVSSTTPSPTLFDGAIAISPKVISDLLAVTGPVTVGTTTTFDSNNFLIQIQKIVQAGQALEQTGKKTKNSIEPKQVLEELFQGIFADFASSTQTQKESLVSDAENWIAKKDVMAYFKDQAFENFAEAWNAGGEVYKLPDNFEGDYLAMADTNVNGQKSDLYMNETLGLVSEINTDGTVDDHLTLSRVHTGNKSPYWWYNAKNQDYIEFFVPTGSIFTNESGGLTKTIVSPINYEKEGYSTDPFLASIESSTQSLFGYPSITTHSESGREVFSTWSVVQPGSSSTFSMDYTNQLFLPPTDGTVYQFVFEKQAGTMRNYNFEIDAPLGYQFVETGLPSWTYQSNDPPGRMIVTLTLRKI